MRSSSIAAHNEVIAEGKKEKHYKIILAAMGGFKYSSDMIAARCELNKHQVSRRLKEMVELGMIKEEGKGICKVIKRNVLIYSKC